METEQIQFEDIEFAPLGEEPTQVQQDPPEPEKEQGEGGEEINTNTQEQEEVNEETSEEEINEDQEDPQQNTEETDKNVPLYKSLVDKLGLELDEDEMQTILDTEETDEGFAQVGATLAEKVAKKKFDQLMDTYPEAKQLVEYQKHGGNPDEFFDAHYPAIDYSQIEIPEEDTDLQKDVIAESLKLQGFEEDDIDETISDYEAGGLLNKQAERSLKLLQKNQEQRKADFEKKQEQLIRDRQKAIQEERQKIDTLIEQEGIKDIQIPAAQRDKFKKYLYEPVTEDGRSQAVIDSQNLDLENRLLIGYLTMNNFDISKLIAKESKNNKVRNLRESLKDSDKLKDKGKGGEETSTYSKNPNFNKLDTLF